jgi:spermidine/putrescine transport system ATP-binding protein
MDREYSVELRQVVKKFGEVVAVDHVSLQIKDGEFFSLLGPSGCGKTTTLRIIAGFEMPTSGQILIQGEPQGYLPPFKRPVNTVFQHYALFPHMNVNRNVAFGLEMQGLSHSEVRQRVGEALEMVALTGMGSRRPKQLSGGQQQRVALARALVNKPKVLLLDEPLGALDLKLRKAMQVELKNLQEQVGLTFIYVTHDQEEALAMSDRIAVMHKGRVLQLGGAEEIYEAPNSSFVANFIGESNFITGIVQKIGPPVELDIQASEPLYADWAEDGIRVGDRAILAIRPEKVRIYPGGQAPPYPEMTRASGRVEQMIYIGIDTRYVIRLNQNASMVIRLPNNIPGASQFKINDLVELRWDRAHARILKE